jgi:plastocyanin
VNKKLYALLAVGIIAVIVLSACGGGGGSGTALTIKAEDIAFNPKEVTAKAGSITVTFQNTGSIEHSFIIDALNVKTEKVQPGTSATVTFTAAAGTYEYYCDVPGHKEAGMKGTLTVTP